MMDLLECRGVASTPLAFVHAQIPDREELVMRGNAELLHRAVENVARNALQHAGASKRIEIQLDASREGRVLLRVRDQGEGIGEEELALLFEPFTRGRASTGFGLRLAIARRAVAVHDGPIRAKKAPEGGVEVQVELPLERSAVDLPGTSS